MTSYELRDSPRTPEGGQAAKAIAIYLNKLRMTNDEAKVVIIC